MPSIPGLLSFIACGLLGLIGAVSLSRLAPGWVPGEVILLSAAFGGLLWALRERYERFRIQNLLLDEIDRLVQAGSIAMPVPAPLQANDSRVIESRPEARPETRAEPRLAMPIILPDQEEAEVAETEIADDTAIFAAVRDALNNNRVELHVQPVVRLPARKLRFVELLARARDAEGRELSPGAHMPALQAAGLAAEFDALMLLRGVQLVRKLEARARHLGFFCNISPAALADARAFETLYEFLRRERERAGTLILEFAHTGLRQLDRAGWHRLERLAGLGFGLSVDGFESLDIDIAALGKLGVRYIKLDAQLLLDPRHARSAPVALEDLLEICRRHEIEPVIAKVETERDLVQLAEYGFELGQGHLFGTPKLARVA